MFLVKVVVGSDVNIYIYMGRILETPLNVMLSSTTPNITANHHLSD